MSEMKLEVRGGQVVLPLTGSMQSHLGLAEDDEEVEILMLGDGTIVVCRQFDVADDKAPPID